MKRIGFILKPQQNSEARILLYELANWARTQGHKTVVLAEDQVNPQGSVLIAEGELATAVDLCVVLGGDGTMLRASAALAQTPIEADCDVPLLGINLGRLGFLSPYDPQQAVAILQSALNGEIPTVQRMRLDVTYQPAKGPAITRTALNDVVISQGAMARLVELRAHLDDCFLNSYRADGLVISTPTGSTAYNLAAGGPVMYPTLKVVAITPICAQGLTSRPLVVPGQHSIAISMGETSTGVILTIDGQWAHSFQAKDVVRITASKRPLTIFSSDSDYFNILRTKLHWGIPPIL